MAEILKRFLSARFLLALMFGITTCAGFLMQLMPVEAFMTLAGAVITFYFTKIRKEENPLK